MPPPNSPPNLPPNFPPGQFHNGPRHAFSVNYPYGNGYMGYSGWGAAAGHWSPPPEDAYGYGLAAYEKSFGESPYGEVGGRYGFGHPPYGRAYLRQQQETTRNNYNCGISVAGPDALHPPLYGDGYDIPVDSATPQQQQQHQHQQNATWAPLPQSWSCLLYTSPSPRDRG